jgi:hypothetical protein
MKRHCKAIIIASIVPFLCLGCAWVKSTFIQSAAAKAVWDGAVDTAWYNASLEEFTILTPGQLAGLARLVNGGYPYLRANNNK